MHTPQQRSSSKRTRLAKRSCRGRSPSPRPGCTNAARAPAPAAASAPAPQQPSRPHTGNGSNSSSSNCGAGGADSVRRRTPTPPTTRTGRTSPMATSARRVGGGIGNGIGIHATGAVTLVLGGRGGTPGSFVPPHLRSAGTVTSCSGGRRGLVRRTHSPKTVASPLSKPVHLSELSRCPVPPMSSNGSSSTQQHRQQQQHARPRPILPESTGSSGKQRQKRKAADDHNDWTHSNKRQTVFLPVGTASSSLPSNREGSRNSHKRRPSSSSSRSRSPKSPRSSSPIIPTARVLTIAPTVRGISEAARILRISTNAAPTTCISRDTTSNTQEDEKLSTSSPRSITRALPVSSGILSFPTETVYTLSTCVRLRPHHHHHHHHHQYQNAQTVKSSLGGKMNARSESVSSISSSSSSSSSSGGEANGRLCKEMDHNSLNILLGLKGKQNIDGEVQTLRSVGSKCDLPLLFVHSPAQHRHHFHFTRPKTFMIKKSTAAKCVSGGDGSSGQRTNPRGGVNRLDAAGEGFDITSTFSMAETPSPPPTPPQYHQRQSDSGTLVPTVTFSESREVLDRITAAFWPGPVAIFAPAKLRRVAELGCPEGKGDGTDDSIFAPVLPPSILIKAESRRHDTTGSNAGRQPLNYVGIRCPSHPLARRCLEEVYYKNVRASPGSASKHRHCTKSSVVIGFDASIPTADDDSATKTPTSVSKPSASTTPTKAKEVCVQLLSPSASRKKASCGTPPKEPSLTKDTIPTVHVLNGEDRRELFSHATCEFGPDASVALIVDDERRTIRIIKRLDPNGIDRHSNVCTATVIRALLRTSPQLTPLSPAKGEKQDPAVAASAGARVITAVLRRWKASEEIIGPTQ